PLPKGRGLKPPPAPPKEGRSGTSPLPLPRERGVDSWIKDCVSSIRPLTPFNFLLTPFNSIIWMRDEGLRIRDCLLSSLSKERAGGETTFIFL
ncbi:MAG: hypothetical protein J6Q93_00745, partial [Prevotella sp.]|nr:hypothetical protein [Prevotella sp.]